MLRAALPMCFAVLFAAGCTTPRGTPPPAPAPPAPMPAANPTPPPAGEPAPPAPPTGAATMGALAEATARFAAELWARLRGRRGNLAVSPGSAWVALAMTHAGARGVTEQEMASVLHLGPDPAAMQAAAGALLGRWNDAARTAYTLRAANRLFGARGARFEATFLERTGRTFGAPLEPVDFAGDAEGARQRINAWVASQTQDRIREILPGGSVNEQTPLVLVNAIYLLAKWSSPFTRERTFDEPFAGAAGSVPVPTMHQLGRFRYAEVDGAKVLELPYQGGELSMTFVLPDATDGLPALEARLDAAALQRWLTAGAAEAVMVSLPKFTVDPPEPLRLGRELAAMGMPSAFDRATADLTGIAPAPTPDQRLYLAAVFHKAFVKVDEQGTEAAAATAVVPAPAGAPPRPAPPPRQFKADHPFLFLLTDSRSGTPLFAGRVEDPRGR